MWSDALAQSGGAGGAGAANPGLGMLLQFLQFVPIFLILYFLLIRPQQQQQKKLKDMLKQLKKGDRVLTTGGIYGTVLGVDEAKAVLRIAEGQKEDIKVEFAKSAIVQVLPEGSH
ncbi:MAG TPA: preprotein translocase subunit YajC [Candidatus Eisenbacteria bacterium]|nr:preprotein translocase subunit YajC [Candidatus Eisenbacteria bacterium]